MLIKVCGMREAENIRQVEALGIDWMGFIFYPRSPRFVGEALAGVPVVGAVREPPVRKVGVFVNASSEEMMEAAQKYKLDYFQLHGNESPDDCYALQKRGFALIKAFSIASEEDLEKTADYEGRVDYFLFDTKCEGYGGSGKQFDWSVLAAYKGSTPFLLSGGIRPESLKALRHFHHPRLAGIDLNSGFETAPGMKDVAKLKGFVGEVKKLDKEFSKI